MKATFENNSTIINHIFNSNYSDIYVTNAGYEKTSVKKPARDLLDFKQYSMHYVLSGAGYLEIDGNVIRIERKCLFFLIPNKPLKYYPDSKNPWRYAWIDFIGTKVNEFLRRINLNLNRPVIQIAQPDKISKLFLQNVTDCLQFPMFSDVIATASFYKILSELLKQFETLPQIEVSNSSHVNVALDYINSNYQDSNLNIKIVASHVGINPDYLSRLIRKYADISFTDYLTRVRINAAVILMDKDEASVSSIAYAVGFSDPYYFSNVFKKTQQLSPREHIKKIKIQKLNSKDH